MQPAQSSEPEAPVQTSSVWDEFDANLSCLQGKQDPTAHAVVEVDKYLNEPYLNHIHDPLKWWESRKFTYPNLYSVAMERLCIPRQVCLVKESFQKLAKSAPRKGAVSLRIKWAKSCSLTTIYIWCSVIFVSFFVPCWMFCVVSRTISSCVTAH